MVKQGTNYYFPSGKDSTSKFVFEIENNRPKHCGKQRSEGFNMETGRNLGREKNGASKNFQFLGHRDKNDIGHLYAHNPQLEETQFDQAKTPDSYLNIDYEMHIGTKADYLFFQTTSLFQATEIQQLRSQCEQERAEILTNVMLALKKPRLAGYLLTGKRSMFLEKDGSLAWLYHCPMVHSPLHAMNQCYDRTSILYESETRFVDPVTRRNLS